MSHNKSFCNLKTISKVTALVCLLMYTLIHFGFIRPLLHNTQSTLTGLKLSLQNFFLISNVPCSRTKYMSPWSWKCGADEKCHRFKRQKTLHLSLESCWLTCGHDRSLWPKPRSTGVETNLGNEKKQFHVENIILYNVKAPSKKLKQLANDAFNILIRNIKLLYPEEKDRKSNLYKENQDVAVQVSLHIESQDEIITILTQESYVLNIQPHATSNSTLLVLISGKTFFGVRHGLETLSQLIVFDDAFNSLQILTSVKLSDSPAFPYRGLMIDTARNFIPIYAIQRMIDGMSYNKLNMLHWHLTDSNSFPFYSTAVPEMTNYGAYSENEIYYPQDVKALVDYALVRGVKIIPELDAPAHAGNGWQWGEERKGYGQLALCVNEEPFNEKCGQPPCGQLNPANPKVYEVLGSLYGDMLDVFDSDLFHMGGDEVTFECWNTKEIISFIEFNNLSNYTMLRVYFQTQAFEILKTASCNRSSDSCPKENKVGPTPILWTSDLTTEQALPIVRRKGVTSDVYIIQTWEGENQTIRERTRVTWKVEKSNLRVWVFVRTDFSLFWGWKFKFLELIEAIIDAHFPIIISNVGKLYLDLGVGTWMGTKHDYKYINWQVLYDFNFERNGYNITKRVYNSRFGQIPQILGGEAPLWTEKVNEVTMDARLWPRSAAFAERLWTNHDSNTSSSSLVYPRLLRHNERMKRRGILVDTRQPKSCLLIDSNCENTQDYFQSY